MKSTAKLYAYQAVATAINLLFPFFSFPYITRVLQPQALGTVNYIDFITQFFIGLALFGTPLYVVRNTALYTKDKDALQTFASQIFSLRLLMITISVIGFLLLCVLSPQANNSFSLVALGAINIAVSGMQSDSFLQGLQQFKFIAWRTAIIKLATLLLLFAFVTSPADTSFYYLILVSAVAVTTITDLFFLKLQGLRIRLTSKIKTQLKASTVFVSINLCIATYYSLGVYLLGLTAGLLAVGFFTTALKLQGYFQTLIRDAGLVGLPQVTQLQTQASDKQPHHLLHQTATLLFFLVLPVSCLLYLFSDELIQIFAGTQYSPSAPLLRILAFLPVFTGISNVLGIQGLLGLNHEQLLLKSVAWASALFLISTPTIFIWPGAHTLAWLLLSVEAVVCLLTYYHLSKVAPFQINVYFVLQQIFLGITLCLLTTTVLKWSNMQGLWKIGTGAVLFLALYIITHRFVLKNPALQLISKALHQVILTKKRWL